MRGRENRGVKNVHRLKRRLVHEAVEENLHLIRGLRSQRLRRRSAAGRFTVLALFVAVLSASTFVLASGRLSLLADDPVPIPLPSQSDFPAPVVEGHAEAAIAADDGESTTEQVRYVTPRPVDRRVFPLEVRKVVLDPGHGGPNSGTVTSSGLEEKDLALDIAKRVRDLLREAGYRVAMTRDDDRAVSLEERVSFANREEGDVFVSIHLNWISTRQVRGVETYFLGPTDDPYLNQLASSENSFSGYSLTDFRKLLEGIFVDVRGDESEELARGVQNALFRSLRQVNPRLRDRGVKTAPFVVLIGTDMPAVLAEVSSLSNEGEAELLSRPLYRQHIADALATGIRTYADSRNQIADRTTGP
jgi:N-acetylmuramoyl-L-alanine amidase